MSDKGIRRSGPGKFDTILDSYVVYALSMGGADEEAGDVQTTNWYGLLRGDLRKNVERVAKENKDKLTREEMGFLAENTGGAIIEETDQGFVSVEYFSSEDEIEKAWAKIVEAIEEMEAEAEEGDPDPSYRGLGARGKKTCVRTAGGKVACGARVGGFGEGEDDDPGPDDEPNEPHESDLTTEDHIHFYQDGKLVLTVGDEIEGQPSWKHALEPASDRKMWRALNAHMSKTQFWPNVWFLSDHGNWHRMQSPSERSRQGLLKAQRRHRR